MAKTIGDKVTIHGMSHTITDISLTDTNRPVFFFSRDFDGSGWYAITRWPNRFTHLNRIQDTWNAGLDKFDAVTTLDMTFRRLYN